MSDKRHLAMDFGADSGRAIVGKLEKGILTMEEIHRFATRSLYIYDSLRWNIYRFYEEILTSMRTYASRFGAELESIGVDTWGVDYGFLKEDGAIYEIPYQYRDSRTDGTEKAIEEKLGRKKVYDITGIQFMNINTLNQMISVAERTPEQFEAAREMLFIGDLLHYLLSGKRRAEFTVASTSQMLEAFGQQWAEEIFAAFSIPMRIAPKLIQAGEVLGNLRPRLAHETGVGEATRVVVPAVHDTASAATAIPAEGENWAYISSGTWCMVGLETPQPVINDASFAMNLSNSGGSLGKNLLLKNVMGLWIIQQCKKAWDRRNITLDWPQIVEKAIAAKPFAAFIEVDDDLFFAPDDCLTAVKEYLRRTDQPALDTEDVGTVARLVYEGLALKYRYVIERLKSCTGQTVDTVHIIGGGSKNALLNQFTADAVGVRVVAGPGEATAMGNLLLQAYGCGELSSLDEIRSVVRASADLEEYVPDAKSRDAWAEAYERFCIVCHLAQ